MTDRHTSIIQAGLAGGGEGLQGGRPKGSRRTGSRRSCLPFLVALASVLCFPAAGQESEPEGIIARAGRIFITEREFLERFELTPSLYRPGKPRLEGDKLTTLYSLVAEKLLAQEATDRQLDRDSLFQTALTEVTKLLARDELYRQEIARKVSIRQEQIVRGIGQARREIRARFLFSPDSGTIAFLGAQIRSAREFDRLVPDSAMGVLRDTATVVWGDADPHIESVAYQTPVDSVSLPVRAGDGWYILRILSSRTNAFYAGLSPEVLRERVVTLLRRREEQSRERAFLAEFFRGKQGFSPPSLFREFASATAAVMRGHYVPPSTVLTPALGKELRSAVQRIIADTLIVAGTSRWTVGEVIDRLVRRGFAVSGDTVGRVPARLYAVLEEMVHQELLAQEALSRGLDRVPEVRRKLEPWRDHYLAGMVRRALNATLSVTEADAYAYLRSEFPLAPVPEVRIREFRSGSAEVMGQAAALLDRGASFSEVVRRFSADPLARRTGGLTEFFPITDRRPIGFIASQLDSGQVYGPIRDSLGLIMIQLVDRRTTAGEGDTAFARPLERARETVLRMKQQHALTLFLAQSARDRGFEVFADRLKSLTVTPLPMVAYRFLGFGGRMFEVPFVEPQLQWLETDPPGRNLLP